MTGERPYEVIVGAGATGELPALVGADARTVVVIHPEGLGGVAAPVRRVLQEAGYQVHAEQIPDGEAAKDITVAAGLWSRLAQHRVSRSDAIVGVGGGAATDLAGFTAATWLRGVRLVLVPTTLLAVVDAAVGGKTAVNLDEGKNLVGAFYPPAGVVADLTALASLPAADYASGLAEVIKAGFIADPAILKLIEAGRSEAKLLWQGKVQDDPNACYVPPTIFSEVPAESFLFREEIFGPVLAVSRAKNFDEALQLANQSEFALTGGLYSRSPTNIARAKEELVCGNLYINRTITGALVERQPFGGFKMSGGGTKAGGREYLQHFLVPRAISENLIRRGFSSDDGPNC